MRRSEERFRLLTEESTDVVWLMDYQGRLEYVSAAALRVLGYAPDELLGYGHEALLSPEARRAARRFFGALAVGQRPETTAQAYEPPVSCKGGNTV